MKLTDLLRRAAPFELTPGDPDLDSDLARRAATWTSRLSKRLDQRAPYIRQLRDYYNGVQPLRYATKKWRETFGDEFGVLTDNWCQVAADSAVEGMTVQGFRFPALADGDQDDGAADAEAWRIWQRNRLDLRSEIAHTESIVTGYSYILVWPDEDTGEPLITVEDPLQTIVELDPANPDRRRAGLKRWRELDGGWHALLFTPEWVWTLEGGDGDAPGQWAVVAVHANRLPVVPIIPLANNPDVYGAGRSDIEPILPLQDAVNKLLADMMLASEFAAYRQRVLLNAEIPTDPITGEPDRRIVGGVNRWLAIEGTTDEDGNELAKPDIKELQAADLSNYTDPIELIVTHIGALSRTPPQHLLGQLVNISGDALKAAQSGQIARVKRRIRYAGEAWEEAIRLAFAILGDDERAEAWDLRSIWGDPEIASEAARADALVKLKELGVPRRGLWRRIPNVEQNEIDEWTRWAEQEAIEAGYTLGSTPNGPVPELPPARAETPPVAA